MALASTRTIKDTDFEFNLQSLQGNCIPITYKDKSGYLGLMGKNVKNLYSLKNYINSNQGLYSIKDIINTDSVYTYIIYEKRETNKEGKITKQEYKFAARPVYNIMESYAKHYSIYYQIVYNEYGIQGLKNMRYNEGGLILEHENIGVILSGEIQMRGSNMIRYNFASGTYMREKFQDLTQETIIQYSIMFDQIVKERHNYKGKILYDPNIKDTFIKGETPQKIDREIMDIWSKLDKSRIPYFILFDTNENCKKSTNVDKMKALTSFGRIKTGFRVLLSKPNSKQLLESVGLTQEIIANINSDTISQVERREILDKISRFLDLYEEKYGTSENKVRDQINGLKTHINIFKRYKEIESGELDVNKVDGLILNILDDVRKPVTGVKRRRVGGYRKTRRKTRRGKNSKRHRKSKGNKKSKRGKNSKRRRITKRRRLKKK